MNTTARALLAPAFVLALGFTAALDPALALAFAAVVVVKLGVARDLPAAASFGRLVFIFGALTILVLAGSHAGLGSALALLVFAPLAAGLAFARAMGQQPAPLAQA